MYKTVSSKIKVLITVIIMVASLIVIKKMLIDPQPVRDIKMNMVYICGSGTGYPDDNQSRYYIEFKKDGTYVLIHDDSRRKDEDYFEDGYRSYPELDIYIGKYRVKNDNYILETTDSAYVKFKDASAVKKNIINYYCPGIFDVEKYVAEQNGRTAERAVMKTEKGEYILGYPNNKYSYDEDRAYYLLFNKSDIKKLPSSVEEFRKQFKMDKKAEQERLAEEARLTEQNQ